MIRVNYSDTVDGSEIRRSPAEGKVVEIPIIYMGFSTIQTVVGRIYSRVCHNDLKQP